MGVDRGGSFECGAFVFAGDLTGHAPDAKAIRASKVEWMSTKFMPTISLITNISWVTRAIVCAVGDAGILLYYSHLLKE